MAVIRQKTQVFNKPVGVRRINTGEAEMWEQISQQADQLLELLRQQLIMLALLVRKLL